MSKKVLDQEFVTKLFDHYKANPFNQTMGAVLKEVRDGYAKGEIAMSEEHMNLYRGMHGGCLYALADSVAGIAAATCGNYVTTLNGNINYLVAARDAQKVICEATVVRAGRTISVVDYKLLSEDGIVFCTGTFNYYILTMDVLKTID